jgi:hypothetical protein
MRKQLWTCVITLASLWGCDTLKLTPETAPDPSYARCISGPTADCVEFLAAWCAEYPADPIRCAEGGAAPVDAGASPDAATEATDADEAPSDGGEVDACACGDDAPLCTADGGCAACTDNDVASCPEGKPLCDGAGSCVECLVGAHCNKPGKGHCDAGECVACTDSAQCGERGVCDKNSGSCVECTLDTEAERCVDANPSDGIAAPACDVSTLTCTGKPRGSVSVCHPCASDSECKSGARCVLTSFGNTERGGYCLEVEPVGGCGNGASLSVDVTSVSGAPGRYCAPRATCEALLDFGTQCSVDADCGAAGVDDGLCVPNGNIRSCTYACSGRSDCRRTECVGVVDSYCDFK